MLKLPKKLEDLVLWLMIAGATGMASCSKNTPSPTDIPTDPEGLVVETGTTNEEGTTEFSTGKPAIIQNELGQPITDSQVTYFTDGEYHALMTAEGDYFSSFSISSSLEPDTLTLKDKSQNNEDIRVIKNQELSDLMFKFSKDILEENQDRSNCDTYNGTTSGECALGAYSIFDGILLYIGLEWVASITGNVLELIGHTGDLEFEQYLLQNNWDHYTLTDIILEDPPITTDLHLRYTSNQPYLSKNEIEIDGRDIIVNMRISDRSTYENPQYGVIEDATVTCLGPTSGPDRWHEFILFKDYSPDSLQVVYNSGGIIGSIFNERIENLEPGAYIGGIIYGDDTHFTWSEDAPYCQAYNDNGEMREITIE
jgi:hypothetical protein